MTLSLGTIDVVPKRLGCQDSKWGMFLEEWTYRGWFSIVIFHCMPWWMV